MNRLRSTTIPWMAIILCLTHSWDLSAGETASRLNEQVQGAIGSGRAWLERHQNAATGSWGNPAQPALTAMALLAITGDAGGQATAAQSVIVRKAYAFIRSQAKPDGGIYGKGLVAYNTALCLSCLILDDDEQSRTLVPGAERFLQSHRSGLDGGAEGNGADGGGAGGRGSIAITLAALKELEAASTSPQTQAGKTAGLDWNAAIKFLENQQKPRPATEGKTPGEVPTRENDALDTDGKGLNTQDSAPGRRIALRHSGIMTYDSLLSLVYAPLGGDDVRLDAFLDWLQENYTIEENPGLGAQGLFYYYHSIAKVLTIRKVDRLKLKDGTEIDWRGDLTKKILAAQRKDGSWVNTNGRWWENDPVLVSSYALLTLKQLAEGL